MSVIATCCWCGGRLAQGTILRADVWLCRNDACYRRCFDHAITYRKASEKAKSGLGVHRLLWLPLPKQAMAMEEVYKGTPRILFGGARGGGKSRFLRMLHYTPSAPLSELSLARAAAEVS